MGISLATKSYSLKNCVFKYIESHSSKLFADMLRLRSGVSNLRITKFDFHATFNGYDVDISADDLARIGKQPIVREFGTFDLPPHVIEYNDGVPRRIIFLSDGMSAPLKLRKK